MVFLIGIAQKLNVNFAREKLPIVFFIMQTKLNGTIGSL